jgi:hypothetical protein
MIDGADTIAFNGHHTDYRFGAIPNNYDIALVLDAGSDLSGVVISGGDGTDLTSALGLSGFETLAAGAGPTPVGIILSSDQMDDITAFDGDAGALAVLVTAADGGVTVDLSSVSLSAWGADDSLTLKGGQGTDSLIAIGADDLNGDSGNDTYVVERNDGSPYYTSAVTIRDAKGADTFDAADIPGWAIKGFARGGNDLVLSFAAEAGGGTVTIVNHFAAGAVETLRTIGSLGETATITLSGSLYADSGADIVVGTADAESLDGGSDTDTVTFALAAAAVVMGGFLDHTGIGWADLGSGRVTFTGEEALIGSDFADTLCGWRATAATGSFHLAGGKGADNLVGSLVDSVVADYSAAPAGIEVVMSWDETTLRGTVTDGWSTTDQTTDISHFIGTQFGDTFTGSAQDETFQGHGGSDVFDGGDGTDTVSYADSRAAITIGLDDGLAFHMDAVGQMYPAQDSRQCTDRRRRHRYPGHHRHHQPDRRYPGRDRGSPSTGRRCRPVGVIRPTGRPHP